MLIVVYVLVLVAAFFFLIVLPQRRRMAAHNAVMAALGVGDEVITAGGIHGTIRAVDDMTLSLEIAPGIVITIARGAVASLVGPPEDFAADPDQDPALDQPNDRAAPDPPTDPAAFDQGEPVDEHDGEAH